MQTEGRINFKPEDRLNPDAMRERWSRQHSDFISAAMSGEIKVPRIPRRRVDRGGFSQFLSRPGVRALMEQWWTKVLESTNLDA